MQPPTKPSQPLDKPIRESALADQARALLRTPAARRLRTPSGVDRRGAEELAIRFWSRGMRWEYPSLGRDSKRLTRFVVALTAAMAEHAG